MLVKLTELKRGEKFIYDSVIYRVLDVIIDDLNPDNDRLVAKIFSKSQKNNNIISFHKPDSINVEKFYRRDWNSFRIGYKLAMDMCRDHISDTDKATIGIDDFVKEYMVSVRKYEEWKFNQPKNFLP
jgi:uncharacterized protein (UPF0128 family)